MRILVLYRTDAGESGDWAKTLTSAWDGEGVQVGAEDVTDWMPMATGKGVDKGVSRELERRARGFDHIHAVGYRVAWACGEAFRLRRSWSMTAYDRPRTTHAALLDRIAHARFVVVPSRAVRRDLDEANVTSLVRIAPARGANPVMDRQAARARLGLGVDDLVVTRWFSARAEVETEPAQRWAEVHAQFPEAILLIAGPGADDPAKCMPSPRVRRLPPSTEDLAVVFAAADLAWLPDARQTQWLAALEANAAGVPCLVDRDGSLDDLVDDDVTGRVAAGDDPAPLIHLLELPLHRQALGNAARARVTPRALEEAVEAYRRALDGKA